jgi:hypothetical protein
MMNCFGAGLDWWWDGALHKWDGANTNPKVIRFNEAKGLSYFMNTINFEGKSYHSNKYPPSDDVQNGPDNFKEAYYMISDDGTEGFGWYHNNSMKWDHFINGNEECYGSVFLNNYVPPYLYPVDVGEQEIRIDGVEWCQDYDVYWYTTNDFTCFKHDVKTSTCWAGLNYIKFETPSTNSTRWQRDYAFKFFKHSDKSKSNDSSFSTQKIESNAQFNKKDSKLDVYPNPNSNGIFNIDIENFNNSDNIILNVFDATGRIILIEEIKTLPYVMDLSNKMKGIYTLKITTDTKTHYEKVIYL